MLERIKLIECIILSQGQIGSSMVVCCVVSWWWWCGLCGVYI